MTADGFGHNDVMGKTLRLDAHSKAELKRILGFRPHALAVAVGTAGIVVGLADRLVYRTPQGWAQVPWHTIEHGRWDGEQSTLRWTTVDGAGEALELQDAAPMLQLFQERVSATIVCTQVVKLGKGHSALITARQDLTDPTAALLWQISPGEDTPPEGLPEVPAVAVALAQLRDEYDLG